MMRPRFSVLAVLPLLLLAWSSSAHAAIALLQEKAGSATGGVTSLVVAYTNNNAAGSLLLATLAMSTGDQTITISTTDSKGNTWSQALTLYDAGDSVRLLTLYAPNSIAGANTVTFTASSAVSRLDVFILEYSGAATAAPLDGLSAGATRNANPQITIDPGSLTTTASGDLVIGHAVYDNTQTTNGNPLIAGSGFTREADAAMGGSVRHAMEDQVVGASGSYDPLWGATGAIWGATGASFKAAGGAARPLFQNMGDLTGAGIGGSFFKDPLQ